MPTGNSRVVVIIGASSGIGRETALRYARRGSRVMLASRSDKSLQGVADECRRCGAKAVAVHAADIADANQVQDLVDATVQRFGHIDVVAQCAAITAFGRFEDLPIDVFNGVVTTNALGAANVARSTLAHFRTRGAGHLVLVGSLLGVTAVPFQSAYVLSKFATGALVRVLRQENRDSPGIRVHGVYPGPVDTPVYGTAANFYGRAPRVAPTADAPAVIAAAIVRATNRRRSSERQIGWVNRPAILLYRILPAAFDALIGPLLRKTSFAKEPFASTAGNVFDGTAAAAAARNAGGEV